MSYTIIHLNPRKNICVSVHCHLQKPPSFGEDWHSALIIVLLHLGGLLRPAASEMV